LFDKYLAKYNINQSLILEEPESGLFNVIVIPCLNEPNILETLQSLRACNLPKNPVEVVVIINSSELADDEIVTQNKLTYNEITEFANEVNTQLLKFFPVLIKDVPKKKTGAGFARKLGMDEAVFRFNKLAVDGIITNLDADTIVDINYLVELEKCFENKKINAASIYFEHDLDKTKFSNQILIGIKKYELYLRYFKQALKYINFPFATHTIGSAFAVRALIYVQVGGMKAVQAGEDFYFIQKAIQTGNYKEIVSTKLFPSSRLSERVIFGTGPAVIEIIKNKNQDYFVYSIASFIDLKQFIDKIDFFFKADEILTQDIINSNSGSIIAFLNNIKFAKTIKKINSNTKTIETFRKAFFNNFNTFTIIRFLNESHLKFYKKQEIEIVANSLLKLSEKEFSLNNIDELLEVFKQSDLEKISLF
jgi:cellulose synthase/poly-beta-1,6-N-acetylglucosamine synthase-like glycosyltransferase